jgi:hypothetical protein
MIEARQARELTRNSEREMDIRLELIGTEIEKAAKKGESSIILSDVLNFPEFVLEEIPYIRPTYNPIQTTIRLKLEKLGYVVSIIERENTGCGLGCTIDDEDKPPVSTFHIKISW